jgi:phosphate transport system substrate-binding protein
MNRLSLISGALVAAVGLALLEGPPGFAEAAQPAEADALALIVHRSNPITALTLNEVRRIFLLETQTWPHGRKITVVLREKGQRERTEAIPLLCGLSEADFDRHVLFQTFRGLVAQEPRAIRSAAAMLRFVFNVPGAIGYVPADVTDDSTKVLRIDGLLPGESKYPLRRPPADAPPRKDR